MQTISGDVDGNGQRALLGRQCSKRELEQQQRRDERQQVQSRQPERQSARSGEVSTKAAALLSGGKVFDPPVRHLGYLLEIRL